MPHIAIDKESNTRFLIADILKTFDSFTSELRDCYRDSDDTRIRYYLAGHIKNLSDIMSRMG